MRVGLVVLGVIRAKEKQKMIVGIYLYRHINRNENFVGLCKVQLAKFRGVHWNYVRS